MQIPTSRVLTGAVLLVCAAVCGPTAGARAASGDFIPDHVLGQSDLTHNMLNFGGPSASNSPQAVATDKFGHLWIADTNNNRVLGYFSSASLANGAPADIVIGQPDFFSYQSNHGAAPGSINFGVGPDALSAPQGLAVDGAGNLYVADTNNSRVLEYDSPFSTCAALPCAGLLPKRVFGQSDNFITNNCGFDAEGMCFPKGLALDANGDLFVADGANSRVLEFTQPLAGGGGTPRTPGSAGDTTPDLVFGQNGSFTTTQCNDGLSPGDVSGRGPDSLCHPQGVAIDRAGDLFVADSHNSRILVYEAPLQGNPACVPAANGSGCPGDTIADIVFGQSGSFYSLLFGAGPDGLAEPLGLALDSSGDLFAVDAGNDRVLEYDNPLAAGGGTPGTPGAAGDTTADRVLGQTSFTGGFTKDCLNGKPIPSATSLCGPSEVAVDGNGNAFVTDPSNNRVVEYLSPLQVTAAGSGDATADIALGQIDLSHNMVNFGGPRAIGNPGPVTIDYAGHFYVVDQLNNRVLGFSSANKFVDGSPADVLIGQPDFFSYGANDGTAAGDLNGIGADSLSVPSGLTTDSVGNLYVADGGNNRVLEYNAPFNSCASLPCTGVTANVVIGQSTFFAGACNHGNGGSADASGLCFPQGLATDANNNLYVADTLNSRVVEFTAPLSNGARANLVFGQPSLTSSGCFDGTAPGDVMGVGPDSLCGPGAVALDINGNLYIADSGDSRVLEFNTPLVRSNVKGSGDNIADVVFGQNGSFTSSACFVTGANADTLCDPIAVTLDLGGNLYVSDGRLLEYNAPLSTDTTADVVIDQNASLALGPEGFAVPAGLTLDIDGNLFLADSLPQGSLSSFTGRRVLEYDKPVSTSIPVAKLALKPKNVNFDEVPIRTTSAPIAVTISNAGSTAGLIESVAISGPFAITANQCPLILRPGTSCSVSVTFTPPMAGNQSGTLSFTDNDSNSPQTVTLSGNGK